MSDYDLLPVSRAREIVVDAGYLGVGRHIIYGLAEVDVTQARQLLRAPSPDGGRPLSFTAFIVASLGRAIQAHPQVQAYRDWRGRRVIFHDVDVVTMIEPEPGQVAIPHIIRAANRKTVRQITDEMREIQARPGRSEQHGSLLALGQRAPRFARLLFFRALKLNPHWFRRFEGTVVLTSVGMFARGGMWGITFLPTHTLGLTVGGISAKAGVHEGSIAIREMLNLTLAFDHDLVDGAPAARFGGTLAELIETAAVLESPVELASA